MEEWYHYILLIVVGFGVGFVNTVAGGGALISLPVLIFLGLPPNIANGTNRVAILVQTFLSTAGFKSKGVSTFPFSIYLGISALFGAILGAYLAVDIKGAAFNRILAIVMMVAVVLIAFLPKAKEKLKPERLTGVRFWVAFFGFFFIGIYGGFINAGVGFLIILFLHFTNHMSLVRANATKVVVVFIYTISALLVFAFNDKIDWKIGAVLAIGNGSGAWFSSRYAVQKGDGYVKVILMIMVVAMAIKLWFFNNVE